MALASTGLMLESESGSESEAAAAEPWRACLGWALGMWACFLAGVYASVLTYRLLLHPLNRFPGSRCRKAAMYDLEQPNRGIATRDAGLHAARRRLWSRGFGDKALRCYEPRVAAYVQQLLARLGQATTGFLAFCYHHHLDRLMQTADVQRAERPSLMSPLIAHYEQQPAAHRDLSALRNDCRFIVIAGSDTVAATLAFALFHLAAHAQYLLQLQEELRPLRPASGPYPDHRLRDAAPHLNAIISETLRLHPPASTIMRTTPPEGITVDGTFVPGNMTVFSSQYAIGRSEALYTDAASFRPERWHSNPGLVKDRSGYAPFSLGQHSCLGRPIALMEMRLVLAESLSRYKVVFAPGFDHASFLDRVHDCMSWHIGNLDLCFTPLD